MSDPTGNPDVLIIGAGPAGLTAATYLGRFLRRVLVADAGEPRACWIPVSHNMPGFPAGITGGAILSRMRDQAEEYGAVIEAGSVAVQMGVFKASGRKKRLFRMSPIHHHFELIGWPETTVIIRFWIVSGICVASALAIFIADFTRVTANLR